MAEFGTRRFRPRKDSLRLSKDDRGGIAKRLAQFFEYDGQARDTDREARLQRYAKYRMWTEGTDDPWPGASDVALSDMTEKSLRLQDTLHNAVLAQRPAINAVAINQANRHKMRAVDALLDYQFFVEQPGEKIIGDLADAFINDGEFTVFVPWVKEVRKVSQVRIFDPIPDDAYPPQYLEQLLRTTFSENAVEDETTGQPSVVITPKGNDDQPWDFQIKTREKDGDGNARRRNLEVQFFTRDDGRTEAVFKGELVVFDGPAYIVKDYDDVFYPPRAANLQPPGPSNPHGAAHVMLRDFPTKDEIARLQRQGFYDLMTREDVDKMLGIARGAGTDVDAEEQQRDDLGGKAEEMKTTPGAESQDTLTRLTVFDRYDIDGDGLDEDVIWWFFPELNVIAKARILQEMYPIRQQRPRPLAEAVLFPVRGRRSGFSMLELCEGAHDFMKQILDQAVDANTISITPWGTYRPSSSMNPETLRVTPGYLVPLSNPQDVNIPTMGNAQAMGMSLNLFTLMQQFEERVAVVGDFQLGRVPAGSSSALRTVQGMAMLAGQGEARPERIVRRFFNGLAEIFSIAHDLNEHFLPNNKKIRVAGPMKPGEDPYMNITDAEAVRGDYVFAFQANAFNTSKQQMQQALEQMQALVISGLDIQLGITTPETVYNLRRDYAKALGVDAEARGYINAPTPGVGGPRILAEEAIIMILQGEMPSGQPMERGGWIEHLQKLIEIEQQFTDEKIDTGELDPRHAQLLQQYKVAVQGQAAQQQQQMQMQAAADAQAQRLGQNNQGGRPPEQMPPDAQQNPQVSGGAELLDETLPGAGGGAQ